MKASVSPVALLTALTILLGGFSASAQDAVIQKDGQRRDGQIQGVRSDAIRLKVGPVETSIPLSAVASVTMQPPKAFNDALASWQSGNAAATLTVLKPLVDNFNGLPTKWASRASALLGEVYLADGKVAEAEAAFGSFQKAYPDAASTADVGLAGLAIAKKDFDTARQKLEPIVEAAKKTKMAESGQNAVFGQALLLMGQVQEASGQEPEALANYLLAVTVFREDSAAIAKAEERANVLQGKKVIVP